MAVCLTDAPLYGWLVLVWWLWWRKDDPIMGVPHQRAIVPRDWSIYIQTTQIVDICLKTDEQE